VIAGRTAERWVVFQTLFPFCKETFYARIRFDTERFLNVSRLAAAGW
jgi:hypothetical protein